MVLTLVIRLLVVDIANDNNMPRYQHVNSILLQIGYDEWTWLHLSSRRERTDRVMLV